MSTQIPWSAVRRVPADTLNVGDTCITPSRGTTYRARTDGSVSGVGFLPLDGTAWTITAIGADGTVTARTDAGRDVTETPRPGADVLRVTGTTR